MWLSAKDLNSKFYSTISMNPKTSAMITLVTAVLYIAYLLMASSFGSINRPPEEQSLSQTSYVLIILVFVTAGPAVIGLIRQQKWGYYFGTAFWIVFVLSLLRPLFTKLWQFV